MRSSHRPPALAARIIPPHPDYGAAAQPVQPNRIDCACNAPLYRRPAAFGDSEGTPEPAHRPSPTMGSLLSFDDAKYSESTAEFAVELNNLPIRRVWP